MKWATGQTAPSYPLKAYCAHTYVLCPSLQQHWHKCKLPDQNCSSSTDPCSGIPQTWISAFLFFFLPSPPFFLYPWWRINDSCIFKGYPPPKGLDITNSGLLYSGVFLTVCFPLGTWGKRQLQTGCSRNDRTALLIPCWARGAVKHRGPGRCLWQADGTFFSSYRWLWEEFHLLLLSYIWTIPLY